MATDLAIRDEQRALTTADPEAAASALAHILATGDLAKLSNEQRVALYLEQCRSLGLNSLSRPFDWLMLDGRLVLYPNKSCAEQLGRNHQISIKVIRREVVGDLFVCEVEGRRPNGVTNQASKYVPLTGYSQARGEYRLRGKDLANAFAKAETGAKRRLVLSMIGLSSPPDADELDSARFVVVDGQGRVLDQPTQTQRALAASPEMARAIREPTYESFAGEVEPEIRASVDQAPTPAELERQRPDPAQRPTLKCDAAKWQRAYFAAVEGTSLATDEGRAAFLTEYTGRYAPPLRTDSLSRFLSYTSDRLAQEMVDAAKLKAEAERLSERIDAPSQAPVEVSEKVHAAAVLTGAPAPEASAPARPEHGAEYTPDQWRGFYRAWAGELRRRDSAYTIWSEARIKKATIGELIEETMAYIGQCDDLDRYAAMADEVGAQAADDDGEAF